MVINKTKQGRIMRIAIGKMKENVEINEPIIRGIQKVVISESDLDQCVGYFTARTWIDAILSHMVKVVNDENVNIVKKNREEIGKNFFESIVYETVKRVNNELKIANNVVVDIKILDELDRLIDTIGITFDVGNRRGHEIIRILKSAIEKAEKEDVSKESRNEQLFESRIEESIYNTGRIDSENIRY
jgi:hypothetical protein